MRQGQLGQQTEYISLATLLYPSSSQSLALLKLAKVALISADTLLGSLLMQGKSAGMFDTEVRRL